MRLITPIDYSKFIRKINRLIWEIEQIFIFLGELFKSSTGVQVYSMNSFLVGICQIQRERKVRLWQDISLKGYNSSKRKFFYDFKVHMVITTNLELVSFYKSASSEYDIMISYKFLPTLLVNSIVIENISINSSPIPCKNMEKDNSFKVKKKIRKGIKTAFSVITSKFGKVIKATSINGFLVKLKLFILAFSLDKFLQLPSDYYWFLF